MAENTSREKPKPSWKHMLWKGGLYMTPFVYAAALIVWGHELSSTLVIISAVLLLCVFLVAGLLHLKDIGGRALLRENFHQHPVAEGSALGIAMRKAGVTDAPIPAQKISQSGFFIVNVQPNR